MDDFVVIKYTVDESDAERRKERRERERKEEIPEVSTTTLRRTHGRMNAWTHERMDAWTHGRSTRNQEE